MSNNILLACGFGAISSKLTSAKKHIDLAKAHNFMSGIRIDAGTTAYGNNATGDTTTLLTVLDYAFAAPALDKVSIVLNINPKFNGTTIVSLNGSYLHVPTLPTNTGVLDWLVTWWTKVVTDTRNHVIALGLDPTTCLEFEWSNELNVGGVNDPNDVNSSGANIGHITYPVGSYPSGTIPQAALQSVDYVQSRVNFHGIPTVGWTFEGEATSVATVEINSFTGSHAQSIVDSCTRIGTNRYASAPSLPFSSTVFKADWETKIQEQLNRIAANSVIGAKEVSIREFGFDFHRCPNCQVRNTMRQYLIDQVSANTTGIHDAGFFCALNPGGSTTTTLYNMNCWDDNGVPYDNTNVDVP
jgi:hypothetical protein